MPLTYNELANLFPNRRGINDSVLHFHTVTAFSQVLQPKGIFIPLYRDSGELNEAIENGAIAAIWDEEKTLPSYTPSYFPVFLTNDLWKGLEDMLNQLSKKIASSEIIESDQTTFCLFHKNSLNRIKNTYDIAEMVKEFTLLNKQINGKGGSKVLEQVIFFTILLGFLITVLLSPIFIPFLRRLKFGQSIREEGPKSHQKKTGTPTMGGVMILLSIIVTTLVMTEKFSEPTIKTFLLLFVLIGFGLLGFLDDFIKVVLKRNLGLTSKQKLLGQILISVIFYFIIKANQFFNSH